MQFDQTQFDTSRRTRVGNNLPLQPTTTTTDPVPAAWQFEAWVRHDDRVFDLGAENPAEGFSASRTSWRLGNLLLTKDRIAPHRFERNYRNIRRAPVDHWYFVLQLGGSSEVVRGDRVARILPGQFAFRSLGRPFHGTKSASESLALFIPRDEFRHLAPTLDAADNTVLDRPLDMLLANYLRALEHQLPTLTMADVPAIVSATRAMITACMTTSRDRIADLGNAVRATLVEKARNYIELNLQSRSLGPDELCRALGISSRNLERLFRRFGGADAYIRDQRLAACHAAIVKPPQTATTETIANCYGFDDIAAFGRLFHAEFGHSPSEARDMARMDQSVPPARPPHFRELLLG